MTDVTTEQPEPVYPVNGWWWVKTPWVEWQYVKVEGGKVFGPHEPATGTADWPWATSTWKKEKPPTAAAETNPSAAHDAAHDAVNQPDHYTQHPSGVECIDIVEHLDFCTGNAIKYLWRAGLKDSKLRDLEKARWYVDRAIAKAARELKG